MVRGPFLETYAHNDSKLLPSAGTCYVCNCIRRLFMETDTSDVIIDLDGHELERQEKPCAMHDPILSWFCDTFHERSRYFATQDWPFPPVGDENSIRLLRRYGQTPEITMLCPEGQREQSGLVAKLDTPFMYIRYANRPEKQRKSYVWSLGLHWVGLPPTNQPKSPERLFDPDWVDLQVARRWLSECVGNHGSKCGDILGVSSCPPAYLIDAEHNCIVEGELGTEYVALSYVWGKQDTNFRTNKGNFADLIVPGGISKQSNIPSTIMHAIQVVLALGERYLWVDSLCIVCDDRKHFQEQLQIMGSIYMSAKLTIVSTDGDAREGLHGIKNVSQPRQLPNVFPWLDGTKLFARELPAFSAVPSISANYSNLEYFQRGWTFQEYMLSRRRLIFGNRLIHWKCACSMIHEDEPNRQHDPEYSWKNPFTLTKHKVVPGVPDFDEYGRLANDYHMRVFTNPEDALPGITGLLNVLKPSFKAGFLCGLPLATFEAALMWHCGLTESTKTGYTGGTSLEPRKPSMSRNSDLPGAVLPSWSWISWRGSSLKILSQEEMYPLSDDISNDEYLCRGHRYVTTPITKWYCHDTPLSHEKWQICPFSEDQNSRDLDLVDQGWTAQPFDRYRHYPAHIRREFNPFCLLRSDVASNKLVYRHPDFSNTLFWRPFHTQPFERIERHGEVDNLQQYQYISCRSWRNWFYARRMTRVSDEDGTRQPDPKNITEVSFPAQIAVVNDSDQVCGWLQVPGEPTTSEFADGPSERVELGDDNHAFEDARSANDNPHKTPKIELVAICCRQRRTFLKKDQTARTFYGVLWVEWKDEVAYRRGCGFIEKEMWDQSGPQEFDLVLG